MSEKEADRRRAFIQSLRDMALFLEQHPTVKVPMYVTIDTFVTTRDEIQAHARVAAWQKVYNGQWFYLHKEFGEDLSLNITAPRETVCQRVVVGQRVEPARTVDVVEWVCSDEPVLAQAEGQ